MKNLTQIFALSVLSAFVFLFSTQHLQAQCSVDAGNDTSTYLGYAPYSCVTLNASATGTAPFSFLWSTGDTTASIIVCDTVDTDYIVSITDSNGCTASDTVSVTVVDVRCGNNNDKVLICHVPPGNPANAHSICVGAPAVPAHLAHGCFLGNCPTPPPPPCTVDLGSDTAFCSGDTLMLDAGSGSFSYLWSDSSTAQTLAVSQSGTYFVEISDTLGCSASDTINVVVYDSPVADAGADTTLFAPACVDLMGTVSGGTAPYNYSWSNGDTTASTTVCDSVTNSYTFTVVDSNGCTSSDEVIVEVIDTSSTQPSCDSNKVLICHVPPGNPGNEHSICIDSSALAAHLAHGDYVGPCANGQKTGHFGDVGSYPNPFSNEVYLTFTVSETVRARLELFNMAGQRIAVLFDGHAQANSTYEEVLNTADLSEGVYLARLVTEGKKPVFHKLILQRD
ncbi:MAG: T9SS type A sorting domain-containing protein [Chitinophagales bacterium]